MAGVFGHDLSADVEEFAPGEADGVAIRGGDAEGAVGDFGGEAGKLLWEEGSVLCMGR